MYSPSFVRTKKYQSTGVSDEIRENSRLPPVDSADRCRDLEFRQRSVFGVCLGRVRGRSPLAPTGAPRSGWSTAYIEENVSACLVCHSPHDKSKQDLPTPSRMTGADAIFSAVRAAGRS
jgi:hypothetical protein